MSKESRQLSYEIFDPTGNITALVFSRVEPERQPEAAAELMRRHPEVEQVGFVRMFPNGGVQAELRMAGGEFCGNASMCAAALLLICHEIHQEEPMQVILRVSGAKDPVEVWLEETGKNCYDAAVRMPDALGISRLPFRFADTRGELSLVRMEGISHLVIRPDSAFFYLLNEPAAAEAAVRQWCGALGAEGLGLMFLEKDESGYQLTPLVYVPGSGTMFWERSCASGSAAVSMALAAETGEKVELELKQPGGSLRVHSRPGGPTWLQGTTKMIR